MKYFKLCPDKLFFINFAHSFDNQEKILKTLKMKCYISGGFEPN